MAEEGYVLASYGPETYLRHAVASARTLRRHDPHRPIALWAADDHLATLERRGWADLFAVREPLPPAHRSLVGVKHHLDRFVPFARTLYADSDIVWCRNPDALWQQLAPYAFTTTGDPLADVWFGARKDALVALDVLLGRRARTLRRFGLTHLPRVLSALMYVADPATAASVCAAARRFAAARERTHFASRLAEPGRTLESCEWPLAMAMSAAGLPVFPWFRGTDSVIVDYFPGAVAHDADFRTVHYRMPVHRGTYELQGLPHPTLRRALLAVARRLPHRSEYVTFTPPALHFGRLAFKAPFYTFAERVWTGAAAD